MWSSIPIDSSGLTPRSTLVSDHALLQWYNPHGVMRRDLNPLLSEEDGATVEQPVLEMNVVSPSDGSLFTPATWTGITQAVPQSLRNFTDDLFFELWVNDRRPLNHSSTSAVLHIDLGRVSEDAFWNPREPPNGRFDTEDKNANLILDPGEDTGLDGLADKDEPGYDPTTNRDPDGDDYAYDPNHPTDYSHINGMEGNGQNDPNARPDTEDLNLNGVLDLDNDYFEATLDLADTSYVAIDVAQQYGAGLVSPDNGWRLFRIPVHAGAFRAIGSADWSSIEDCRLWLSDMAGPTNLQFTLISVVGEFPPEAGPAAALGQNYPNPFNPNTAIPYELYVDSGVRLAVYDVQGRLVRELVNGVKSAGPHFAFWSGRDTSERPVASGVYVYRLDVAGKTMTKRMVLVR